MNWRLETDGGQQGILWLSGSLTVLYAGELRQALMEALNASAIVTIEFGEDLEIDIAGLQMLCSAHRTFLARSRKLVLKKNVPELFRQEIEAAGLQRHQGCSLNPYNDCLWIGGNLS